MSEFQRLIRSHVAELRNRRSVETNWPAFRHDVESNSDRVANELSVRWLKSICDTYADFGNPVESRDAMAISLFINMLRLAETVRYLRGPMLPDMIAAARAGRSKVYEELSTLHIDRQDTLLNVSKRMNRQLAGSGIMETIWQAVLRRVHASDSVIAELRDISTMPERYLPIDAAGMADNYGVV